jgi:hypothetical protein
MLPLKVIALLPKFLLIPALIILDAPLYYPPFGICFCSLGISIPRRNNRSAVQTSRRRPRLCHRFEQILVRPLFPPSLLVYQQTKILASSFLGPYCCYTGFCFEVDFVAFVVSAILLRNPHTNIGDSETPGGMKTYCSPAGRYSPNQGQLPADFWRNVEFKSGKGRGGGRFVQRTFKCNDQFIQPLKFRNAFLSQFAVNGVTGCINSSHLDRLNPNDAGGQYDSSGGANGQGNPQGSICLGYALTLPLLPQFSDKPNCSCNGRRTDTSTTWNWWSPVVHELASSAVMILPIVPQTRVSLSRTFSFFLSQVNTQIPKAARM